MAEESATRDPIELSRALSKAPSVERTMAYYDEESVYDMSRMGMGVFEGRESIRGFLEDWDDNYEEHEDAILKLVHLGGGIVFLAVQQNARPWGVSKHVRLRDKYGYVMAWKEGKVARMTPYTDVEEARADAERLAGEGD